MDMYKIEFVGVRKYGLEVSREALLTSVGHLDPPSPSWSPRVQGQEDQLGGAKAFLWATCRLQAFRLAIAW